MFGVSSELKKNYHWDAAYYYKNFVTPLFLKKTFIPKIKGQQTK